MQSTEAAPFRDPGQLRSFGPTVLVNVGFDSMFVPGSTDIPRSRDKDILALIDTGATTSAIDIQFADKIGLPRSKHEETIADASGTRTVPTFSAQIYIPSLDYTMNKNLLGANLAQDDPPIQILLGRDFLSNCAMFYNGLSGQVTLLR